MIDNNKTIFFFIFIVVIILFLVVLFKENFTNVNDVLISDSERHLSVTSDLDIQSLSATNVQGNNINAVRKIQEAGNTLMPRGMIMVWSGPVSTIPAGWALCNGQNGTPNLQDRFISGAGSEYRVGVTGGKNSISLTSDQLPSHTHNVIMHQQSDILNTANSGRCPGRPTWSCGSVESHLPNDKYKLSLTLSNTGKNAPIDIRPEYFALCYIMKL